MAKLIKHYYYDKYGKKKINCYLINISKKIVEDSKIDDESNLNFYADKGKIIIEASKK